MSDSYFKPLAYSLVEKKLAYQGKRIQVEELIYRRGKQEIHREHVLVGRLS